MYNQNQPQQARNQYNKSQYNPQSIQSGTGTQPAQINAGRSQYAQNNNYYQASARQGGGVNQYGANYSSGTRDEDIGNAYYQNQTGTGLQNRGSQYTGNATLNSLNNAGNNNYASSQFGGSQYNPQNLQSSTGTQPTQSNAGRSQYAQNNNYYQASARQGGGVNQYGANYSSGTRDEDIGNAYYQNQTGTGLQNRGSQYTGNATLNSLNNTGNNNYASSQFGGSQYNPQNLQSSTGTQPVQSNAGRSQYAQNNNYYQASARQGGGVNQYGAHYSSGTRDEDVGNAYYQSTQPVGNTSTTNQYNPQLQQSSINNPTNSSQYAQKNNYYQSSFQQGTGVNQYGAHYTSANRDEDVSNAYYNRTSQ